MNIDELLQDIQHSIRPFDLSGNKSYLKLIENILWYSFNASSSQKPYDDTEHNLNAFFLDNKNNPILMYIIRNWLKISKSNFKVCSKKLDVLAELNKVSDYFNESFCFFYLNSASPKKCEQSVFVMFLKHLRNSFAHGCFNLLSRENVNYSVNMDWLNYNINNLSMALKLNNTENYFNLYDNIESSLLLVELNSYFDILEYIFRIINRTYEFEKYILSNNSYYIILENGKVDEIDNEIALIILETNNEHKLRIYLKQYKYSYDFDIHYPKIINRIKKHYTNIKENNIKYNVDMLKEYSIDIFTKNQFEEFIEV